MKCYFCNADNIQGIEQCIHCGADLAGLDLPEAHGGLRGRLLTDTVRDLQLSPPLTVEHDAAAEAALDLMRQERHGCVMVTEDGKLVGIVTEKDVLRRVVRAGIDPTKIPVQQIMTASPVTVQPSDPPAHAVHAIVSGGFRHVPVASDRKIHGFLSVRNLLRYVHDDVMGRQR